MLRVLHDEPGLDLLYLRQTDLLRHALSNIRARRDQFHRRTSESARAPALHVAPGHVLEWNESSEAFQQCESRLLEGLLYLSLTDEEHIRDPDAHQSTVDTFCDSLGVPSAPVETDYQKIAPRSLRDGVANDETLARYLQPTDYAAYLDE